VHAWLRARIGAIVENFWFLPVLLMLGAVGLAFGLVALDGLVSEEALSSIPRVFGAGAEGSRTLLSTLAGSMVTVTGVTFSVTVVAVVQAGTQYSPRVLREFLRDRSAQLVLGSLLGMFVYCVVVLRTVREGSDGFVPSIAVLGSVVLSIGALGLLVGYLQHVASTLEASGLLARIGHETAASIDDAFPDALGEGRWTAPEPPATDGWRPVAARRTGYLQRIEFATLERLARHLDARVVVARHVGDFVREGAAVAWIEPGPREPSRRRLRRAEKAFTIAPHRTTSQDPRFGLQLLSDVAVRALSPGTNDPTTALTAIDHLGAVLVRLAGRELRPAWACGPDERVLAATFAFADLVEPALEPIRRSAAGWPRIYEHLLAVLADAAESTSDPARRRVLVAQAGQVRDAAARALGPDDVGPVLRGMQAFERSDAREDGHAEA
jgi:uncharacterized membrane protein